MKLYADTANFSEIKELYELGAINGVTTNPSIVAKEPKGSFVKLIQPISEFCMEKNLSLSIEVFSTETDGIISEAKSLLSDLSAYQDCLKIKVPVTRDGLKAIKVLSDHEIKINATACYTEQQLILAANAGAKYVSLFYCRLEQSGGDCKKVLTRTRNFIDSRDLNTEIIAGSIRTQTDASNAWAYGAHIVTTSSSVINEMIYHPKTTEAVDQFTKDFSDWLS